MKKRQLWGLVLIVLVVFFSVGYVGLLDKNDQHMKGNWTFEKDVTVKDDVTVEDDLAVTDDASVGGDLTVAGDTSVTGSVTIADELVLQTYDFASGAGTLTWALEYGNVILCSGSTQSAITLPAMAAAQDGYMLIVKNVSGATERTLTPNNADYIETTQGTMTGTSDNTCDAAGDIKVWVYDDKGTSTSGVWTLLWADQA